MADHDDRAESDLTAPIVDRHEDVRRRFAELWSIRTSGDAGALALDAAWQPIANLLDGHSGVEAAVAHRLLLNQQGVEAPEETHNARPAE